MAWQPNKPAPNDRLKNSQADLKNNYAELDTTFKVNHEAIGSGTDEGKHKFVTLTSQTASGDPAWNNQPIIYQRVPATPAISGSEEVFIRQGPSFFLPLTAGTDNIPNNIRTIGANNKAAYFYLGSGLCAKMGNITLGSAQANDTDKIYNINIGSSGSGGLDFQGDLKIIYAHVSYSPAGQIPFGGTGTVTAYVDHVNTETSGGNQLLRVRIKNKSGGSLGADNRIYFYVIGQVSVAST